MTKKFIPETDMGDSEIITAVEEETIVEVPVAKKRGFLRRLGPKKISIILLITIAVAGVAGSYYYHGKYSELVADPNAEARRKTEELVGKLSKLMELPQGEIPTIATISDKEKLAGQTFFAKAENGDVLFAYTTSMEAILWRPSTNKIINVAPITINPSQNLNQGTKKVSPDAATSTRR